MNRTAEHRKTGPDDDDGDDDDDDDDGDDASNRSSSISCSTKHIGRKIIGGREGGRSSRSSGLAGWQQCLIEGGRGNGEAMVMESLLIY